MPKPTNPDLERERKAREWKEIANKRVLYDFLSKHNPRVPEIERHIAHQIHTGEIIAHVNLSVPYELRRLRPILEKFFEEAAMKVLRMKKAELDMADLQEMLGVAVPIPQDVLRALGIEAVPVGTTVLPDGRVDLRNIKESGQRP